MCVVTFEFDSCTNPKQMSQKREREREKKKSIFLNKLKTIGRRR